MTVTHLDNAWRVEENRIQAVVKLPIDGYGTLCAPWFLSVRLIADITARTELFAMGAMPAAKTGTL